MNAQDLKNSILQLAMEGKLVEQRKEEGTARELLQAIQAEKARLVAEKKIKKAKPLPPVTEEEKPFDIPESWEWVRLGEVVSKEIKRGKSPHYTEKSDILVFAQKCNTKAGYIDLSLAKRLEQEYFIKYPEEELMMDKDIVINSTGTGTMGRIGYYQEKDNPLNYPVVPDSHVTIIRSLKNIYSRYVYYVLKVAQPIFEKQGEGSTNQKELRPATIKNHLIPLPPLAEQKRIVAKIEELLPLVEKMRKG